MSGEMWQQKIVIIKSPSLSVSAAVSINKNKKWMEKPEVGKMIYPRKISERRAGARALLIRCVNNSQASTLWCFPGKKTSTTPTPKTVMSRRTEPLSPDSVIHSVGDGVINAYSGLPFGHNQTPGSGMSDLGSGIRGSRFEARSFSGFWSSGGKLLIFFVFTLTFEAKRRKLIEGLISTHQPRTPDEGSLSRRQRGVWLINSSLADKFPSLPFAIRHSPSTRFMLLCALIIGINEGEGCQYRRTAQHTGGSKISIWNVL